MAGCMPAGLQQSEAGEQFSVALDLRIVQVRMIPMRPRKCESRIAAAGELIVMPLHDKLAVREGVMKPGVIDIEVGADDGVNVLWAEMERGKAFEHCFLVFRWRRLRRAWGLRSHT